MRETAHETRPTTRVGDGAAIDDRSAARAAVPLVETFLGPAPARLELWDGTSIGQGDAIPTIRLRSPDALRRVLWAPGELGVARAFVAGEIDVDGDLYEAIRALRPAASNLRAGWRALPRTAAAAKRLGALGRPLPPPPEEARPRGRRHSAARDAAVVGHHYDVGNDFYRPCSDRR